MPNPFFGEVGRYVGVLVITIGVMTEWNWKKVLPEFTTF
jgi:hypothetical protein